MNKLSKYLRAPFKVKVLLVQTTLNLVFAQLCVRYVSLPVLIKIYKLKKDQQEQPGAFTETSLKFIEQVNWAVATVHNRVPFLHHARCLAQALTARQLLKKRRLPSVLFLGAAIRGQERLEAHAWLSCGPVTLNFGDESKEYAELAKFY